MLRSTGTCLLVLLAALTALSGCRTTQTYEGEKRDREDIALLKVPYYAKGMFITVESIDGDSVKGEAYAKLAMLPGHHFLAGRVRGFGQLKEGTAYALDFYAVQGQTYALDLAQRQFSDKMTISLIHVEKNEKIVQLEIWP